MSAVECVKLGSQETAHKGKKAIDADRMIGHSFGGYVGDYIHHTNQFILPQLFRERRHE
jgi:hypothetical protein